MHSNMLKSKDKNYINSIFLFLLSLYLSVLLCLVGLVQFVWFVDYGWSFCRFFWLTHCLVFFFSHYDLFTSVFQYFFFLISEKQLRKIKLIKKAHYKVYIWVFFRFVQADNTYKCISVLNKRIVEINMFWRIRKPWRNFQIN